MKKKYVLIGTSGRSAYMYAASSWRISGIMLRWWAHSISIPCASKR